MTKRVRITEWLWPGETFFSQYGKVTSREWLEYERRRLQRAGRLTSIEQCGTRLALCQLKGSDLIRLPP